MKLINRKEHQDVAILDQKVQSLLLEINLMHSPLGTDVVVCFVQDIDAMIKWGGDALWNEIPYAYLRREKCGDNVADALQRIRELVDELNPGGEIL